jgi:hypothetical protein
VRSYKEQNMNNTNTKKGTKQKERPPHHHHHTRQNLKSLKPARERHWEHTHVTDWITTGRQRKSESYKTTPLTTHARHRLNNNWKAAEERVLQNDTSRKKAMTTPPSFVCHQGNRPCHHLAETLDWWPPGFHRMPLKPPTPHLRTMRSER